MADGTAEDVRLAALRGLGLLDTDDELRFDRFTRLAAALFKAPIALVSLVDERRQWFKSCIGLDIRETPREQAFCDFTIRGADVLIIADAAADLRTANNPLVLGPPRIRFYAGAPLRLKDGSAIGTLCVIDTAPRAGVAAVDLEALADLAQLVVDEIETSAVTRAREMALSELKHRMGNVFGQVAGLISLGDSGDISKGDYIAELRRRVLSLHEVNRRLADNDWSPSEIGVVVAQALKPALGDDISRVVRGGAALRVNARTAMTLSMIVSELASNSLKYGALRSGKPGVSLAWSGVGDRLRMTWTEPAAADAPAPVGRVGFGTVLLNRIAPAELNAQVTYSIDARGVFYDLTAPLAGLT